VFSGVIILYLLISFLLVLVDRLSKSYAIARKTETFDIIPGFIRFIYVENRGIAFGLFQGKTFVIIVLSFIAVFLLVYLLLFNKFDSRLANISLSFIAAGGIGNLYDRIVNGFVVDFIEFSFFEFPVFNTADIFVNIGAFLLIIYLLINRKKVFSRDTVSDKDD
jgi:signal peptidase II